MKVVTIAVLVLALLQSCIPFPHRSYRTPVVHGRVLANGQPVGNLSVRVVADPAPEVPCAGQRKFDTLTDANGEFSFCPMPDFQMFLVIMAHRRFKWTTCASVDGEWKVLQESVTYTLTDAGPREIERLDCEIVGPGVGCIKDTDIEVTGEKLRAVLGAKKCAGIKGGT